MQGKIQENLDALELLADLQAAPRDLTDAERGTLKAYHGWGALAAVFDDEKGEHADTRQKLLGLVTPDEYASMRASVLDAYFTPESLVRLMWSGLARLGFAGGRVLEPTVGSGAFIEHVPDALRDHITVTGIEIDAVSARLAKALYPGHYIVEKPFEAVSLQDEAFDAAIGNPPYDARTVFDRTAKKLKGSIHTFTMAKAMKKVRAGGVGAFVVSRYALDGFDDARDWLLDHTRLLAAYRLPVEVFKDAGAEVITDVVFLQRVDEANGIHANMDDWLHREDFMADGERVSINRHFDTFPDHILGAASIERDRFYKPALNVTDTAPGWADALDVAMARDLGPVVTDALVLDAHDPAIEPESKWYAQVFGFALDRNTGEAVQRLPDHGDTERWCWAPRLKGAKLDRLKGMLDLRDRLRDLLDAEGRDAPVSELNDQRAGLRDAYRAFSQRYKAIHDRTNAGVMGEDPDYALLQGLELDYDPGMTPAAAAKADDEPREPSWSESDVLHRRTVFPEPANARPKTPEAALLDSLKATGGVDMERMIRRSGLDSKTLVDALTGQIFPTHPLVGLWVSRKQYLSGNVREKLETARQYAEQHPQFQANVDALESVLPEPVAAADIVVPVGAAWLPGDVLADFARSLVEVEYRSLPEYVAGLWHFADPSRINRAKNQKEWGASDDWPFTRIFERICNNRSLTVYTTLIDGSRVQDMDATRQVEERARAIREAWEDWLMADADRRERLEGIYNERFNCYVTPQYDGGFLLNEDGTLPGSSGAFVYDRHQIDAAWRIAQDGTALIDHVVGAGKTLTAITGAMLAKRMGRVNKPCFVVPSHLVGQWADEFRKAFPDARVLAASEDEFAGSKRSRLFARIAMNEWDAVIVPHSSFQFIDMPPHTKSTILDEIQESLEDGIRKAKESNDCRQTVRSMERAKKRIENKIEKLVERRPKDRTVTLDDMGIDSVLVDEYHKAFKNLFYMTEHHGVGGLGKPDGSMAAFDLLLKARWIQEKPGPGGLVLLTGTPISNSVAEMCTVLRFLALDVLQEMGIEHFDAWASLFATPTASYELTSTGGYQLKTRFRAFNNLPELMRLYSQFADVVHKPDLQAIYAEKGLEWPTPPQREGGPIMVHAERSPTQAALMAEIVKRADTMSSVDPKVDNALKIFSDAGKIALDARMFTPDAPDFAGSKVNECCRNVCREYLRWNAYRGTQLIFADSGTPKGSGDEGHDLYNDLKAKLIDLGMPAREIAFIHDAPTPRKKKELFRKVRRGDVRVLIGSTFRMGEGMNVQERLVAKHDLDAPFRPSDVEQRDGRIDRRGNHLLETVPGFEVALYRYGTMLTLDAMRWAILEQKAHFINQIRKGTVNDRTVTDADSDAVESGFAAMKAELSGNPRVLEHFELQEEYKRMESLLRGDRRARFEAEGVLSRKDARERDIQRWAADCDADLADLSGYAELTLSVRGESQSVQDREAFADLLTRAINQAMKAPKHALRKGAAVGALNGLELKLTMGSGVRTRLDLVGRFLGAETTYGQGEKININGLSRRLSGMVEKLQDEGRGRIDRMWSQFHQDIEGAQQVLDREPPVTREALSDLGARILEIEQELAEKKTEDETSEDAAEVEAPPEPTFSEWLAEHGPIITPAALAESGGAGSVPETPEVEAEDMPPVEDEPAMAFALAEDDAPLPEAADAEGAVDPVTGFARPMTGETLDLFSDLEHAA
ncbi:DEAD/DEAH box helicase family protein [Thioalkalivibrio sp. K90mix]|uniref:DEAD/DEAH box helicase family protein n=1 Tax=Thioalkalivibrio sp. (strain K90mix) TaxID=396595 RepID=UPI000195A559|nr:DEAD/DEAH box helicase family protein [Thioalkalivibrio sp. K90mix]